MILDLQKVWSVMNFITEQEDVYNEKDIYPYKTLQRNEKIHNK